MTMKILVIHNVCKRNNIISLLDSARACGFRCLLIGCYKLLQVDEILSQEVRSEDCMSFETLREAQTWLAARSIPLVGVEIMDGALSLLDDPFSTICIKNNNKSTEFSSSSGCSSADGDTGGSDNFKINSGTRTVGLAISIALMPGNEGTGLSQTAKDACTGGFVYIPQYGSGTASLNVCVATTLILFQFNIWESRMAAAAVAATAESTEATEAIESAAVPVAVLTAAAEAATALINRRRT